MINKALLHPWVRCKAEQLLECGRRFGLAPTLTSAYRTSGEQIAKWNNCILTGARFPVKHPGCSQHEYGLAFDAVANAPRGPGSPVSPGMLVNFVLCKILPDNPLCAGIGPPPPRQAELQALGAEIGLVTSGGRSVHFATFPASVFDSHMQSNFGVNCQTCRPLPPLDFTNRFFERPLPGRLGNIFG